MPKDRFLCKDQNLT